MASKNTVKVLIDGKIVTLSGYESEEYLQRVASYLNNKIAELSTLPGYSHQPQDTRSTLLALNIADDYFKAKAQADSMEEDMESKDRETYDIKHDLIAAQIQIDKLKQEIEALRKGRAGQTSKNAAGAFRGRGRCLTAAADRWGCRKGHPCFFLWEDRSI